MCVPSCHEAVKHHLSRRGLFRGGAAISAAAAFATAQPDTALAQAASFSRVVDLTHTLSPSFPTFTGEPYLKVQQKIVLGRGGVRRRLKPSSTSRSRPGLSAKTLERSRSSLAT